MSSTGTDVIPVRPWNDSVTLRLRDIVKRAIRAAGYDLVPYRGTEYPPDFSALHTSIIRSVQPYTMTSPERLYGLIEAVRYVLAANIPGDIVECGVWKGGSIMAAALTLCKAKQTDRELYLFDTFEGMPRPSAADTSIWGEQASDIFESSKTSEDSSTYCRAPMEQVWQAVASTGYPQERIHLIKGRVEETVPGNAPQSIAVLRLDTDWYESTKHELVHLYPRLSSGGVLIVDDYGHWRGCKRAVDEYSNENGNKILLIRIDYTGRLAVKI